MKNIFYFLVALMISQSLLAQTKTWTGATSTDWATASNWSPSGVPNTTNDAVVINLRTNQPTISGIVPNVNLIYVNSGATLTVNSGGTLNASSTTAVITLQGGNLINDGTINLSGGGTSIGLSIGATASVTNRGTITTNNLYGISLQFGDLNFTNESTGVYTGDFKANANTLTLTNRGTINYSGGTYALSLGSEGSSVLNTGTISVTAGNGISNPTGSTITNNACAKILMTAGNYENGGTTTNTGLIQVSGLISNTFSFTNNSGGVLKYGALTGAITNNNGSIIINDNPTNSTIFTYTGTFTGTVNGIFTNSTATNSAGTFTSPNTFTPSGALPAGSQTLYAKITPSGGACNYVVPFTYDNVIAPSITTTGTLNPFSSCSGTASSSQSFTVSGANLTANILVTAPTDFEVSTSSGGTYSSSVTLTRSGSSVANTSIFVRLKSTATGSPSGNVACTSNGATTQNKAASGTVTTTPNNPTGTNNSTICNGSTASLTATCASGSPVWYNASSVAIPFTGSPYVTPNLTSSTSYNVRCENGTCNSSFVPVTVTVIATATATDAMTWNGSVSTDWTTPCNWTPNGVPTATNIVIIPSAPSNQPSVSINTAVAFAVEVQTGATFTITNTGQLTVNGFKLNEGSNSAFFNKGTIQNNGKLIIGNTAASGGFIGLHNMWNFNNNTGSEITIDRVGLQNDQNFNNSGKIIIGSLTSPGGSGLANYNTFTNNVGGEIIINRSTIQSLINYNLFTNWAKITIGSEATVGSTGLSNVGTFSNRAGAEISIDRSTNTAISNSTETSFTNAGLITIGAAATVGQYGITNQATFNNNACGKVVIIRGTLLNAATFTYLNIGLTQVSNNLTNNGTFTNTGVLKYGTLTGTVTSNQGTSIIVNDTPTPIFTYGGTFFGTIGIFTDAAATASAGTFTAPNTFSPSGLPTGSQTLYAKITPSGGGCNYVVPFTYDNSTPNPTSVSASPTTICSGSPVTLSATCSTGTVTWYNQATGGTAIGTGTSFSQNPTANITYYATCKNGAVESSRVATSGITVTDPPTVSFSYPAAAICKSAGTTDITRIGTPSSGGTFSSSPSGLTINSGTGRITPSSSTAGNYTVTLTIAASGGCPVYTATTALTITAEPSATIGYANNGYCTTAGVQNIIRNGTSGGTYAATPSGLSIDTNTGQITPSTSTPANYTVIYTIPATGGCSQYQASTNISISSPANATIAYAASGFCSTDSPKSVNRNGTAGGTFSAAPAGLSINSSSGLITPSSSSAGTYTVTYSIAATNGCPAFTTTTSVAISTPPSATIGYTGSPFCGVSTPINVNQTGTSGGTFSSSPAGLSINPSTGQITPNTSTAGTYTVTYTVSSNCPLFTATTSIALSSQPSVPTNVNTSSNLLCGGASVTLSATCASGTVTWYNQATGGTSIGTGQSLVQTPSATTTYYVNCNNGICESSRIATNPVVIERGNGGISTPYTNASFVTQNNLYYNKITLTKGIRADSMKVLVLDGGLGVQGNARIKFAIYSDLNGEPNTLLASSDGNAAENAPFLVAGLNKFRLNTPTYLSCGTYWISYVLSSNESIAANFQNGDPVPDSDTKYSPFIFGNAFPTVNNLTKSTNGFAYNVYFSGAADCQIVAPTVNQNVNVCSGSSTTLTATCSTGTVTWYTSATASIGTANSPLMTPIINANTSYYVACASGNCVSSRTQVNLTVIAPPNVQITGTNNLSCAVSSVTRTASGGNSYLWSNNLGTNATATITSAGTYTVTVTGANGCTATATTTVTNDGSLPNAQIAGSDNLSCTSTSVTRTASGGSSYLWSNGLGTNATATITSAGTYTVTVTGANGCTATATTTVTNDGSLPNAQITGSNNLSCTTTSVTRTASGGSSYLWSNNLGTNATATITSAGTYTVTVTGANGCTATATTSVTSPSKLTVTASNSGPYQVGNTIELSASGATSYSWTGPNGFTSTVQNPTIAAALAINQGIYTVTGTSDGCSSSATTNVIVNSGIDPCAIGIDYQFVKSGNPYQPLFSLTNGMSINQINEEVSIIAVPICPTLNIESVRMEFQGVSNNINIIQSISPYALFDNTANNVFGRILTPGVYSLTVTGYSQDNLQGNIIYGPTTITFTILPNMASINAPTVSTPTLCSGSSFTVNFSAVGSFNPINQFRVELSDANGSFGSTALIGNSQNAANFVYPTIIGTSNSTGSVTCTIPSNIEGGSNYRIRVVSTDGVSVSPVNANAITIHPRDLTLVSPTDDYSTNTGTKQASQKITATNKINASGIVNYQAGKAIILSAGFEANAGTVFEAKIAGCNN